LIAALSVALVALPLAIGIAEAPNVEPITGIFSCIIGLVYAALPAFPGYECHTHSSSPFLFFFFNH
jgi:MFS superfamily sulfate permease-like transporter